MTNDRRAEDLEPSAICHLPFVICHLPFVICHLPSAALKGPRIMRPYLMLSIEMSGRVFCSPPVKTLAGRALVVCHDLVNVNPGAFWPPVGVKTNLVPPSSAILPTRGGPFSCSSARVLSL